MIDGIELLRRNHVRLDEVRVAGCAIDDEIAVVPADRLEPWLRRMRFRVDYAELATDASDDVPRHRLQLWTDDDVLILEDDGDGWDIRLRRVPLAPDEWIRREREWHE